MMLVLVPTEERGLTMLLVIFIEDRGDIMLLLVSTLLLTSIYE